MKNQNVVAVSAKERLNDSFIFRLNFSNGDRIALCTSNCAANDSIKFRELQINLVYGPWPNKMIAFAHSPCSFHGRLLDQATCMFSIHANDQFGRNSIAHRVNNPDDSTTIRCRAYNQPPKKPGSKNWLKEHKLYRKPIPLDKIGIGERRLGTVRNLVPWGAYVSIGAEKDGLVHVRDMSDEYVAHPSYIVAPGDCVEVFVKYVDIEKKILALSLIPVVEDFEGKYRVGITALEVGQRILAIVKRVTNYGAYVDVGCTTDAWVHVGCMWGEKPRATLNELRIGEKIWVVVEGIDLKKKFISCRARTKFGYTKLKDAVDAEEEEEEHETVLRDHPRYGKEGRPKPRKNIPQYSDMEKPVEWDDMFGQVIDKSDVQAMKKAKAEEPKSRSRQQIVDEISRSPPKVRGGKRITTKMLFADDSDDEEVQLRGLLEDDDESDAEEEGDFLDEDEETIREHRDSRGKIIVDQLFIDEMEKAATERYKVMDKSNYNFLSGKRIHLRPPKEVIDPY
eukprot:Plantae.Rhodophyta-Hildenbrandia_rubra.ctg2200.p1 GENE.Plantae.Rhodophyta-Hildenbrandia_rubra.ctg2200~~Plantae.Rhodophyta-Hildenbrandia_rubra.ctg2200.p1  ORF type:complete len:508 (-),score=91.51 Plantae.Rhodophyta-Hildenbrandia_rubra.ctg2200:890-2413(-)